MGLGVGVLLIAIGAVLAFAVNVNTAGNAVDIHTVGWILMGVGAVGVLISMAFWSTWAGPGYFTRRGVYPDPGVRRTTIDEM